MIPLSPPYVDRTSPCLTFMSLSCIVARIAVSELETSTVSALVVAELEGVQGVETVSIFQYRDGHAIEIPFSGYQGGRGQTQIEDLLQPLITKLQS
jgi:hypothetical protein